MFDLLIGNKAPPASTNFLALIDNTIKNNQSFLRTVQKWRNLQVSYIGKLAQLQSEASQRNRRLENKADVMLYSLLEILQNHHKNFVNKFNHDILITNFAESEKIVQEQKTVLQSQKFLHKDLIAKKEILEKVRTRKLKLKKTMEEELTLLVFSYDSVQGTMDKKLKRFNRTKQIEKEQQQYEFRARQTKQIFDSILDRAKQNLKKFNDCQSQILLNRTEIATKIQIHLSTFAKSLSGELEEMCKRMIEDQKQQLMQTVNVDISNDFIVEEQAKIVNTIRIQQGYLQQTLKIINNKTLDNIIEYSKDKQLKKRIKQIIESQQTSPEQTDQFIRQVQIVKKILKSKDASYLSQYNAFITKGCRFRLNFVFILQLFRLNSKFELSVEDLKPIIILINSLLETCHQHRDAFVLKQTMVLMLTYFVVYRDQQKEQKLYILNLFKKYQFWQDLQLWQSILIQCIYLQKKATIKMILTTSAISNKNQLLEAQKTSVLNQILYVVRNMILFDFCERDVKEFSNKFVRMLKQDDRFLRDVYRSIDSAIKEEAENKPTPAANLFIQQLLAKVWES